MAQARKKRKTVNVGMARAARERGLSYAQAGHEQNVTATAVYYALNPKARKPGMAEGRQRSVYLGEEIWDRVITIAYDDRVSQSSVVADILTGRRPTLEVEPVIPGVS